MDNAPNPLRVATLIGVWLMVILVGMNTCAVDRLEQQIIRNRQLIEQGGVGIATRPVGGSADGAVVTGWGGHRIEVERVEGAADDAPLTLADKPKPQGDVYVQRQSGAPSTLNYYATNEGLTRRLAKYSLEGMININPDNPTELMPWLATSWSVDDDKLTYTYTLRRGVKFADGRPFTSKDVKFSFDVMRDPAVKADHLRGTFEQVQSLETPDPYTVVVRYRNKDWRGLAAVGYHLKVLNAGWYEEHIPALAEKYGVEEFSVQPGAPGFGEIFNKIRVPCPGTGPYFLPGFDYNPDEPVDMLQNPGWWGMQVQPGWFNFAKLRTVFITDDVAAFEEFRKGKFDVMVIDGSAWDDEYSKDEELLRTTKYYNYDHMGIGFSYVAWNARQPPFDDARVRRAMTHLMDREWILEEVMRGRGWVGRCYGKPAYPICQEPGFEPLPFDVDKARELLAEAGWTDSDGDGVLDKNGQRFEVQITVGSPRRFYSQVVGVFQEAAAKVGIRVSMRTLEWATFIEDFNERRFDGAILYASHSDPWISPKESFHSSQDVPNGQNYAGIRDEALDELLDDLIVEFDDDKRLEMYWQFNHRFQELQPLTILNHGLVSVLQSNRFEDARVLPTGLRIHEYWVKPENVKHVR